jgi:hypothetical protein
MIEVLKQAVDWAEKHGEVVFAGGGMKAIEPMNDWVQAGRQAIAELESQEPVAWRTFDGEGQYEYRAYEENETYADGWNKRNPNHKGWVDPLYTHSQRTWAGLTDEDIDHIYTGVRAVHHDVNSYVFCQAIEAKLKDKNCVG